MEDLERVTSNDIEYFLGYLSHYRYSGKDHNCNERAKARKLSSVRAMFKYFFNKGYISVNNSAKVATPKLHDKPIIRLDAEEIYNIIDNIPNTIILILISYILKPSVRTLIFAMCLTGWIQMARFIRNQILIIRDRDYNVASRCLGTPTWKIMVKNLLPYLVSVIMLRMALTIPAAIGNEVFITYIGLGLPVDTPSLGNLINEGRALITSPALRYQLVYPTIILSFVTISFYIIGNAFSDAADPRNHT